LYDFNSAEKICCLSGKYSSSISTIQEIQGTKPLMVCSSLKSKGSKTEEFNPCARDNSSNNELPEVVWSHFEVPILRILIRVQIIFEEEDQQGGFRE
jgi:hypothetical protein